MPDILSKLKDALKSYKITRFPTEDDPTTEVQVPTEVPRGDGVLDRLRMDLGRKRIEAGRMEGVSGFVGHDESLNPGVAQLKRDASGRLIPPQPSPDLRDRFEDPALGMEGVARARAEKIREAELGGGGATIGPISPGIEAAQALMPEYITPGLMAGRQAAREEETGGGGEVNIAGLFDIKAGDIRMFSQVIDRFIGAVHGGASNTAHALAKGADSLSRLTGMQSGGLFDRWAGDADFWNEYFKAKSGRVTGTSQKELPGAVRIGADVAGRLAWDLPQIMAAGKWGLAMHGGAYGLAEGGVPGMISGAISGALTHGIFSGITRLPSVLQLPAAAGAGGASAYLSGGGPEDVLTEAATWGILSKPKIPGSREGILADLGEFASRYPEISEALKTSRAAKAARRLADRGFETITWRGKPGMSREEFVLRFPEMRQHLNDAMAEEVILGMNPDAVPADLRKAGGALAVLDFTLNKHGYAFELAQDMVRQRIGLPSLDVAAALKHLAEKSNDISVRQQHLEAKARIQAGETEPSLYWKESILRGELNRRGVDEVVTGEEYVAEKYGSQGWNEITGKTPTERKAMEDVQARLNRMGILSGTAAAEAEADNSAGQGLIPDSILRLAYEARLAQLTGMSTPRTPEEWINYYRGRYVPRGRRAGSVVEGAADPYFKQLALSLRQGKAYYAGPGYLMVAAPPGYKDANARGMIQQHRLIAEMNIGRILRPGEVAHHKNHIPWDNSPENIVVMTRREHQRHHNSAEGLAIDARIVEEAMERGPVKTYQMEDLGSGEMFPAKEGQVPGKREVLYEIQQRERRPGVNREVVMWGDEVLDWELQQVSRGKIQARPGHEIPAALTLPGTTDRYMGLDRIIRENSGTLTFVATLMSENGERFARELGSLTKEEASRFNQLHTGKSGEKYPGHMGDLIRDIAERFMLDRPAGGTRPAKADILYTRQQIREPFESGFAGEGEEPGPGEVFEQGGKVVARGEGVRQRELDSYYQPKVRRPPAGVIPWPKDRLLSTDFKDREQLTVRDVVEGHSKNEASTVNMWEGDMAGTDMWALSVHPERTLKVRGKKITEEQIYNFIRKNTDLLSSDPRLNVGTWYDAKSNKTYVDVALLLPKADRHMAEQLARMYNQKGITLLDKEMTFPFVSTGGTGEPLKGAGWLPEGERLGGLYRSGEKMDLYHFGVTGEVSPHAMGRGQMGEEAHEFERGYTGRDMLKPGYLLKSNYYTPESRLIEPHRWGGKTLGKGQVDKGQLFDVSDATGDLTLDQQALRAGKRGWYDPKTGQVRLFTQETTERLGIFTPKGKLKDISGKNIEQFLRDENVDLTADPDAPVENYGKSKIFGGGNLGIVAPGTNETAAAIARMRFLMFDRFQPIHELTKMLEDAGIDVPVMENPSILVKLLGGVGGRAEAKVMYKRFRTDSDGWIVFNGKSLRDIYAEHKGDMPGLDDYITARRALEIDRNNSGRAADKQVDVGIDLDWARRTVSAGRGKYDATAKEFTGFFHGLLDELADSGLVEADVVAKWKKESPEYAPMRVDMEDIASRLDRASGTDAAKKMLDRVMSPVKRLHGSQEAKIPPTQAAVLMTYEITNAVERNRAAQAIINLRDLSPEMAKLITPVKRNMKKVWSPSEGKEVWMFADRLEKDVVGVSFDGKHKFFRVPKDVADSMKMIYETGLSPWVKAMATPARWLRTGATAAPEFAFRNPLRDWLTAFMNSKSGFNPITDFPRGLFQLIFRERAPDALYKVTKTDPEAYWKWKASGGEWSMMVSLDKALGSEAVKKMHEETDTGLKAMRKYLKTPLGYLEKFSEMGEKPTRIGVFERSRRKGMSDVEAAVESREASTDFAVRGSWTKSASAMYTFLNARAQTTMKLGKSAVENPAKFAIKGLAAAGIPSIVLYAINRDDPDYWKRDQMERDMFWFLPLDIGGRQVKIPKGEIGLIFGTGIEKILQALDADAETKPAVTAFLGNVLQGISPVGNIGETLPTFARPLAEWVNNRSYYYGTPLESKSDESVAPYLRYKPQTSETMKAAGKLIGASPIKLENTLRGLTGGVGRHTLRLVDQAADALGLVEGGARPADPQNIPGVAGFVSRRAVGFESEPAKQFYEMVGKIDMTKNTIARLEREKGKEEEMLSWAKSHQAELALISLSKGLKVDLWDRARDSLSELRKTQNIIASNKELTAKEKRAALNEIDKKVSAIIDPLYKVIMIVSGKAKGSGGLK